MSTHDGIGETSSPDVLTTLSHLLKAVAKHSEIVPPEVANLKALDKSAVISVHPEAVADGVNAGVVRVQSSVPRAALADGGRRETFPRKIEPAAAWSSMDVELGVAALGVEVVPMEVTAVAISPAAVT